MTTRHRVCVCVSRRCASSRSSRLGRRRLTREISCISCISCISRVDFLDRDDGGAREGRVRVGLNDRVKKKERRTNARAMGLLAIDDDGGDLAKGDEERARARVGRLLRTRLGSNL